MPENRTSQVVVARAPHVVHAGRMDVGERAGGAVLAQEGDARFRLMFERSADAILLLDTATNKFVDYNQATLDMLGLTREEISALHPSELSPARQPDGRESFEKANEMIATAIRNGSHRFEWVHRSPRRDDFPVEVLLTPLPLEQTPTIVVVWRDITERKRNEEALRQSQRLESLGVLAGGIAHDFNNLLTAIIGHLDLARRRLEPAHAARRNLDMMETAVSRAADLTRQMLAYGGMGRFAIEPIDLSLLVREMMELLRASVSRRVVLSCELTATPATVEADKAQTQQVIMNLITNAAEAIGDGGGTIALRVGPAELDAETAARDFAGQDIAPGRKIKLEVEDSGHGMTPEVLSRIFDPFFTTKQSGRGLGLSALRGILKAHRAGIRIRSEVGVGSSFHVYFQASSAHAARPVLPDEMERTGEGTVLLVDDETNVRVSLRAVLEDLGFTVLEAADGREAVDVYRANHDRIDWVLMDLTMPRMDGHEAFLRLREINPDVIVVLSSGWAETEVLERFEANAPAGVLSKPFTVHQLQVSLARLGLMGEVTTRPRG